MLILTRNNNESIMIGEDIKVKMLGRRGGQLSIGIEAPKGVSVHREEVYLRIKEEERQAGLKVSPDDQS